jgi:outer membrane beta-barrel protein
MTIPHACPARALLAAAALLLVLGTPTRDARAEDEPAAGAKSYGAHISTERTVELTGSESNVVRSGPGPDYAIAGVYPYGEKFVVIAKSDDWYNIRLSGSETGWIHASLCREFADLSDLEFRPNPRLFSRVGSFGITAYSGAYAFDRKSNSLVVGGRLGYHVFEYIEIEGGIGWSHIVRPAEIVENLFELSLTEEDFHMLFYQMNMNLKVLPGRQMVPFITVGLGSTIMKGESESSFNYGAGTYMFVSKRVAVRWEFRDHRFESGYGDARRKNQNAEFSMGTTFLF